ALEPAASTGSPSSTTVDQDAPSPSNSQTTPEIQSLIISNDVEEENQNLDVAHMNNDPFFVILIPENVSEASSSSDVIPTIVHTAAPNLEHYDAFLTSVEAKNYKDALTQAYWIEAIQEELNEFERLEVWELVPRPDKVMVITLKWTYKPSDGFVDQDNQNHVYKLKKALYGLEQPPRACDPVDTPMVEKSKLDEDTQKKAINPTHYRRMVGTLMYLTATRPDLTFVVCMCARYQAKPTEKHLHVAKRIYAGHAGCKDTRRSTS
nr:retrovirus-related Pol polyprotein from transposon TNT 1-94 [Tanacetum cinerariifolium]